MTKKRLLSLDVMRGMTVALMILVNNGVGHDQYAQLMHSKWNGLTLCDLVFPFFLFMVGVSIAFSQPQPKKVVARTIKLFLLGIALHFWDDVIYTTSSILTSGTENILSTIANLFCSLRIPSVLGRIALSYCAASLIARWVKERYTWYIIITLLLTYTIILRLGNGYVEDQTNILAIVDRSIFGAEHLYYKNAIDPEGLLGTISGIAHTLIGLIVGRIIRENNLSKTFKLVTILGTMLLLAGIALSYGEPFNKRIWTSSYALFTCGLGTLLLSFLYQTIDMQGHKRWCAPFQWFGMNAIVLYVVSEMLSPICGTLNLPHGIHDYLMNLGLSPQIGSLLYALLFVSFMTMIAFLLFRKKIFVKI